MFVDLPQRFICLATYLVVCMCSVFVLFSIIASSLCKLRPACTYLEYFSIKLNAILLS